MTEADDDIKYHWRCACCGRAFESLPTSWAVDYPDPWAFTPEDQRLPPSFIDKDFCRLVTRGEENFFIRSVLEIPIVGHSTTLMWGVWISLSRRNFDWAQSVHQQDLIGEQPDIGGWLSNRISGYPPEPLLLGRLHFPDGRLRPVYQINDDIDHPLACEQREGVTIERVRDIALQLVRHEGSA